MRQRSTTIAARNVAMQKNNTQAHIRVHQLLFASARVKLSGRKAKLLSGSLQMTQKPQKRTLSLLFCLTTIDLYAFVVVKLLFPKCLMYDIPQLITSLMSVSTIYK